MAWARILDEHFGGNLVQDQANIVKHLFKYCPLCGARESIELFMPGLGRDRIACADCGAIWHLKFSALSGGLSWVELEKTSVDGRGQELLGVQEQPQFWQNMAITAKRQLEAPSASPTIVQREVTINREIVKIPCDHCGALIDETGNFCFHCGAPRSKLKFQNPPHSKFCSNCGRELAATSVFCGQCGSRTA
jgi:hypothetical protein